MSFKMNGKTHFTIDDAAALCGVNRTTIARAIRNGDLQAIKIGLRQKAIPAESLDEYRAKFRAVGLTAPEIAALYGKTRQSVHGNLKQSPLQPLGYRMGRYGVSSPVYDAHQIEFFFASKGWKRQDEQ